MKRRLTLFFALCAFVSFSQSKSVTAPIADVTLFLSGAQVTHKGGVTLKKGENTLVLSGLTAGMDVNSIQILGNKDYTILSVKHQMNYTSKVSNTRVRAIQDSIKLLGFQTSERASLRAVYQEEKAFLQANRSIKGDNGLLIREDLAEMADFYRSRMKEIEYKILDLNQTDRESNEKLQRLQTQLSQLQSQNVTNPGEIEFVVTTDEDKKADVVITYLATNAGWTPYYDLRAEDIESDIEFTYRAKVWQGTGVDWKRVNLTISTGNPNVGAQVPALNPWYVNIYSPQAYRPRGARAEAYDDYQRPAAVSGYAQEMNKSSLAMNNMLTSASYTTITSNSVSTEFKISIKYDIASDNQPVEVAMQKQRLKASYKYVAIPKLEAAAYLQADIIDWMQYSLLSGESNIYFKGTFVGNGYIDPALANDTLQLSLGRDNAITVKRDQVKDFCKTSVFGVKKSTSKAYEITIVNTKKKAINIEVYDQVPLTQNADLEVVVEELSGATQEVATGKVTWKMTVEPEKTQKRQLRFTVKYPKKNLIQNL
ncbi:MAG: DUF4139 domain-containing protein [Flavobacteriales bacterium]|jgi:uncharacterized protein (TIGR02231 family)|nr:DUF4139 domain-containing protein [Flavobacteriales bacterium]MDP4716157.1 DUF4139 domain-containing protein [Flavobacteriales bacterium]MDP4732292.1 DUF4139 domain-containing protein [Flavobacteriales bacterium]MDP4818497.1 DUF4139 domain-containing protein [Flavobacteriales bacterium]MDP4950850.1 DUF4139 domain-containing protein [Flavobacteriales bacterium]